MDDVFARLDALAREEDFEGVESQAVDALEQRDTDPSVAEDLWRYIAWARFEQSDFDGTIEAARFADDPLYEAKALFHKWDFGRAREALADCAHGLEGADAADAAWYGGLLEDFEGGDPDAYYQRAFELAPTQYPLPRRLRDEEIDRVVSEALTSLPPPVAAALEDAVVAVVSQPAPHPDVDPLSLGLYIGIDRMQRSVQDGPALPPRIEIYRRSIERLGGAHEEIVEELRITLLHEIAHHLGFDEDGVAQLGLA